MDHAVLDDLIQRLLVSQQTPGKPRVRLGEQELLALCSHALKAFSEESVVLQLPAPITICGDIHGQFADLLRHFEVCGFPPQERYVFLGDYVDRGKHSIETICLLFCLKLRHPDHVYLLRGNHECANVNRVYGFYDECKRRFSLKIWKTFTDCFNVLPVAAVIEKKIFCVHGGLSPDLTTIDDISAITRPIDCPANGLLSDLLWSDPDLDITGFGESDRGVGFAFGPDMVRDFLARNDLQLICRAHQVVEDGYEFFAQRQLVTVFSAPNYCGEFDNAAAVLRVSKGLMCSFAIIKPS
eukprot:m.53825 g.53825  ORF g.53825 m.53825 type:complete len:297 (+) comp11852_c2_seq1:158-1048(+)